jgi:TRAP-type C4-dicarboxylate transport system permease large subunit
MELHSVPETKPELISAQALSATRKLLCLTTLCLVTECGLLVGGVLLILGVALGFTHYLVDAQLPDKLVEWATRMVGSKWLFLLGLNVVLLVGVLLITYFPRLTTSLPRLFK